MRCIFNRKGHPGCGLQRRRSEMQTLQTLGPVPDAYGRAPTADACKAAAGIGSGWTRSKVFKVCIAGATL
jgi:hypothetical protein